jgi:hypothetical protein
MADRTTGRHPTPDEAAGIAWWNALTEPQRAAWCERAGTAVPAEAWAEFKRQAGAPASSPVNLSPGPGMGTRPGG